MNQLRLEGYRDARVLEHRADRTLWRAVREVDGCPVVVKASNGDPTSALVQGLQHEYDILQRLDLRSVVRAYAILHGPNHVALVLEDLDGEALEAATEGAMEPRRFLRVA